MNKEQADRFVEDTFKHSFDERKFRDFIYEILNCERLEDGRGSLKPPQLFTDYIEEYKNYGYYIDPNGYQIYVISVKLKRIKSIDRARVMQRNFAAEILRGKVPTFIPAQAAIIAYYGDTDERENWRLSFVKLDSDIEIKEGKPRVKEILSPAKRFSFLVGSNEPSHTCMERFRPLVQNTSDKPTLKQLEEVFGVEAVTKEFFIKYRDCYSKLKSELDQICSHDELVEKEFKSKNINTEEFAKKLLGQIVFLYFLQKKGWLGSTGKTVWSNGPKDFMKRLFKNGSQNGGLVSYVNFFDDVLEPLFYDALNNDERPDNLYPPLPGKIPYLNGGLFEPLNKYDWKNTHLTIKNDVFEDIFDTFERYNFTIKEDEPLEREIAVDPEMLGKIFEGLLKDDERGKKGTFYTPRFIVHYICQHALIQYLEKHTNIPSKDLESFIQFGELVSNGMKPLPESVLYAADELDRLLSEIKVADPAIGSGAFPVGMMTEIVRARQTLTHHIEKNRGRTAYSLKHDVIENSLYGVDIDPAAVDIAKLRIWLSLVVDYPSYPEKIDPLPNLDYKIMVGNSLVETFEGLSLIDRTEFQNDAALLKKIQRINAELKRLYSERDDIISAGLASDPERSAEINKQINTWEKRKANLEADNVVEFCQTLDETSAYVAKKSTRNLTKYRVRQIEYYHAHGNDKKNLMDDLTKIEWNILENLVECSGDYKKYLELQDLKKKNIKPFFLWELYFSDVFSRENPGFDCIIGNPPYVSLQKMDQKEKDKLLQEKYETYVATGDIYCLFYEKGYNLLRDGGVLGFITSNSWLLDKYGEKLRKLFSTETNPKILIDAGKVQIFGDATVAGNILLCNKDQNQGQTLSCTLQSDKCRENLSDYIQQNGCVCEYKTEENWVIMTPIEKQIQMKIEEVGTPLRDWDIQIYRGILTGYNDAFIIDTATRDKLIQEDSRSAEVIRPILRGRDIERYGCKSSQVNNWLIATFPSKHYDIDQYPAIRDYLLSFGKQRLEQSGEEFVSNDTKIKARKKTNNKWFETQDSINYWEDFSKQKIVWGEISDRAKFMIDESGEYFTEATTFILTGYPHLKYLLAVLNSKVSEYAFGKIGTTTGMGTIRWKKYKILEFMIPQISVSQQMQFEEIVDNIIKNRRYGQNTDDLEGKIDNMLYEIFGFGPDEIRYINGL